MSTLSYARNHEPHQQGEWFDYTGFRYKDYYDIELRNGLKLLNLYPNGDGWHSVDGRGLHVKDGNVAKVRLRPDSELDAKWNHTGPERIERNLSMFGVSP